MVLVFLKETPDDKNMPAFLVTKVICDLYYILYLTQ